MKINIGQSGKTGNYSDNYTGNCSDNYTENYTENYSGNQNIDYRYENYRPSRTRNAYKSYYGNKRSSDFKWVIQLLVSGVILLIIGGLFRFDIPFTGPVKEAVKYLMNTETNVQPVFSKIVQIASQQGSFEWPMMGDIPQPSKTVSGSKAKNQPAADKGVTKEAEEKQSVQVKENGSSMILPLSGKVTRLYGWTEEEGEAVEVFHQGLDISVPVGTKVKAASSGTVIKTGRDDKLGRYALVRGENGQMQRYANLSEVAVQVDETVKAGDLIGKTGNSEQKKAHLHFEVIEKGRPVDPLSRLGIDISSESGPTQPGD